MNEETPEAEAAQPDAEQQNTEPAAPEKADETDWKAEARKWEQRAKENQTKAREFERQRQASMTEAERAVAEAEQRGRTAAASEYGQRLARTEFDALAGRRNPGFDTASALEFVDLSKFVDENGEPDAKAIKAAVERLVPAADAATAGLDLGARTSATGGQDFNQLLRRAAGRA